ncbi:MAG: tetratricopeptide repeat protein, partial [Candidatus Omnitrophica bacterium]|nr:tetratricopeptide repeat protein [Candidatus Omnitrophota bacterium]
ALLYLTQNKINEAANEYEIALKNASKLDPKNISIYKSLGAIYLQKHDFVSAERIYKLILELSPLDAEAYFLLGNVYEEQKKNDLAVKAIKRSIELKADYAEALNFLGYMYVDQNRNLDDAYLLIKRALVLDPDNGAYVDSLGWYYFKKGRFQDSLEQLNRAIVLMQDPVIFDHLGEVYFKLNDSANARKNWEKSLQLDPKQPQVKSKLDKILLKK